MSEGQREMEMACDVVKLHNALLLAICLSHTLLFICDNQVVLRNIVKFD